MIGGEDEVVAHLTPIFAALAPGRRRGGAHARPQREGGSAEQGYLHCGPHGAGHFVKMVHNGIEYGAHGGVCGRAEHPAPRQCRQAQPRADAETTPLRDPEHYRYEMDLPEIAEVWRRGSVIGSWLLDLTAARAGRRPAARRLRGPRLRFGRRPLDDRRPRSTKPCRRRC